MQTVQLYDSLKKDKKGNTDEIQQILAGAKWIWTGAGFVESSKVALE